MARLSKIESAEQDAADLLVIQQIAEETRLEGGFNGGETPDDWKEPIEPAHVVELITKLPLEDRKGLAKAAVEAGRGALKEAYRTPHDKVVAERVANLILGFAEFPEEAEAEITDEPEALNG